MPRALNLAQLHRGWSSQEGLSCPVPLVQIAQLAERLGLTPTSLGSKETWLLRFVAEVGMCCCWNAALGKFAGALFWSCSSV